ncbi:MAG: V-type ATP synthase subunit K [Lachnospiraceae bacterium]|jgi:V/A-type H+-transporting ATPase subunit K|nr:V-type ATP synthase subunit K [Lachnospiraceae bacterium]
MSELGMFFAVFGMALCVILGGIGSAVGVGLAGQASAGVVTEDPGKFSKVLILQLLPSTQGIYGFLVAILAMARFGVLGGDPVTTTRDGLIVFAACLPAAITCLVSGIHQGRTAVASIGLVSKRPEQFTKSIIFPAMVETYAILGVLISILAVFTIKF